MRWPVKNRTPRERCGLGPIPLSGLVAGGAQGRGWQLLALDDGQKGVLDQLVTPPGRGRPVVAGGQAPYRYPSMGSAGPQEQQRLLLAAALVVEGVEDACYIAQGLSRE